MTTNILSRRERSIFAAVADALLAPAPPLPPVRDTDAVAAFDFWLSRAPRINRMALRTLLVALGIRWRRTPPCGTSRSRTAPAASWDVRSR